MTDYPRLFISLQGHVDALEAKFIRPRLATSDHDNARVVSSWMFEHAMQLLSNSLKMCVSGSLKMPRRRGSTINVAVSP